MQKKEKQNFDLFAAIKKPCGVRLGVCKRANRF